MEETLENDFNTGGILKECNLSYYIGETISFTIYTHCANLLLTLNINPVARGSLLQ